MAEITAEQVFSEIEPLWLLHDALTLHQAAALIAGIDPNKIHISQQSKSGLCGYCYYDDSNNYDINNYVPVFMNRYEVVFYALAQAMLAQTLHGIDGIADNADFVPSTTLIKLDDILTWLKRKNFTTGFFFPNTNKIPDYLNPKHPRYTHKLAACVKVWLAMEDKNLLKKGIPAKEAMKLWLGSRYKELELFYLHDNSRGKAGDINEGAISEITRISNWSTGAPKTPG